MSLAWGLAALLGCALINPASADTAGRAKGAGGAVRLVEGRGSYPLGRHLSIMEDPSGRLTVEEAAAPGMAAKFIPSREASPSFGFNSRVYWLSFRAVNLRRHDERWYLELQYPHMDRIEVYYRLPGGPYARKISGDTFGFREREILYHNFVFSIPLPPGVEQPVYLRFSGSCSKQFPLVLWSSGAFAEKNMREHLVLGGFYGILLVMAIYHLILFFFIRDRNHLYYVIHIVTYGIGQLAYNGMAYQYLWPSLPGWHRVSLPFLISFAMIWTALLSRSFLRTAEHARGAFRALSAIMVAGALLCAYAPFGDYLTAITSTMVLMAVTAAAVLAAAVISMARGYRPARFFLIAWIAFLGGIMLIALNKLALLPAGPLTEYGIQIGSALEVTLISLALADRLSVTEREKREAQEAAQRSREKYKHLAEGSNDIIFTLDDRWRFTSVNGAIMTHLQIDPAAVTGTSILSLMHDQPGASSLNRAMAREKLEGMAHSGEALSFRAMFRSSFVAEPKEMLVRLEYVAADGKSEILGTATSAQEDHLSESLDAERLEFTIGNYLTAAEEAARRVTRTLQRFMGAKKASLMRIAVREMIINAIEHGNLEISYAEKSRSINDDGYFDSLVRRRQDPAFRDRRVRIEYELRPGRVIYRITDQGKGFNHRRAFRDNSRGANREMLAHGRGISMARNIFDSVRYNRKGNQVTMVKNLKKGS